MATQAQIKSRIKKEMSDSPRVSVINSFSNTKLRDILLDIANLAGGAESLEDLDDVFPTGIVDGQILMAQGGGTSWANAFVTSLLGRIQIASGQTFTIDNDEGFDNNTIVTASLTSGTANITLPDVSGHLYSNSVKVVRINNRSTSTSNLIVGAPDGFDTTNAPMASPYSVTSGSPDTIEVPPGDFVILRSIGNSNPWEFVTHVSAASGADNLGNHTATQDLDLDSNDLLNVGNIQAAEGSSVALTSQALVPLSMANPFGTYYGTHAAPATSGSISISAAGATSGYAEILYQAASAPTITGITDQDVTSSWDNTNINVIVVYQHADGTYIAKHAGVRL